MKVLYIGPDSGTCRQRRLALERLGHAPYVVDPWAAVGGSRIALGWSFRTGALGVSALVERHVRKRIAGQRFDLALVDGGETISPRLVAALKQAAPRVICLNLDNPFVPRDGARWRLFQPALPGYDLFVTPRRSSAEAALRAGAKRVLEIKFAADEVAHRPRRPSAAEVARFASDVSFVGTWMPERGAFLSRLIAAGVPLRIFGPRWSKAPEFEVLKPHVREGYLDEEAFAAAISCSRISLGLVSKGNEDLHTTRSLEIPALGGLLCAVRTQDHEEMYADGDEAVLWSTVEECADKCRDLLARPDRIDAIARAGHSRVHAAGWFNEPLMAGVLAEAVRPDAAFSIPHIVDHEKLRPPARGRTSAPACGMTS